MSESVTRAEVSLAAVAHNVGALIERAHPAAVCAVVKADGYGHGAVPVARAALGAGAVCLAVAHPGEGRQLRDAGIDGPILLLSEPRPDAFTEVVAAGLQPTLYTDQGIEAAARAAESSPVPVPVHLKVNTGMNRVGADPADGPRLARAIEGAPGLVWQSFWTHCAVADEPENPFTATQLERFDRAVSDLAEAGTPAPIRHAANSAVAIAHPAGRYDLVRVGIAVYGLPPSPALDGAIELRPALRLRSEVSLVRTVGAGEGVSYGHRYTPERDTRVATVPVGYADGVDRRLSVVGGEVLIRGRRRRIAGVVTMDQLTVDCGDDQDVIVGDEVVLIGGQGDEEITANEWAGRLDTIGYEVVCGIGARVPRVYA